MEKRNNVRVLGIVAEYNPFHNGHKYQLDSCKALAEADYTVAVMSGNFIQRGEPAILDKWYRCEMALKNGVDLVVELPAYYSLNGANQFAKGAIRTLKYLGCVTHLGFGSESADVKKLTEVASRRLHESKPFKERLAALQSKGLSYGSAVRLAYGEVYREDRDIFSSNNLLAIEYILNAMKEKVDYKFITVKRRGESHLKKTDINSTIRKNDFLSGSSIRNIIKNAKEMGAESNGILNELPIPQETLEILNKHMNELWLDDWYRIDNLVRYTVLCRDRIFWDGRASSGEGIEGKLINDVRNRSIREIIDDTTSKRYTKGRIKRLILQTLIDMQTEDEPAPYVRVIGFNSKGRELLSLVKKNELAKAPIITNPDLKDISLKFDVRATDFYNLIMKRDLYLNSDFVKKPIIL